MNNNFNSISGLVSSCLIHHWPYPCPVCTSAKICYTEVKELEKEKESD